MNSELYTELKEVFAEIDRIASDNRSGAAELLGRASAVFSLLETAASTANIPDREAAISILLDVCAALVRAQPDMAPLARLASHVAAHSSAHPQPETESQARDLFAQAARFAHDFFTHALQSAARVASVAVGLIPDGATVLTHSRSSTVLAAFVEARREGRSFKVIATESRPGLEGRTLAEQIARQGVEVTLVADAAADSVMDETDLLFFGADRVTPHSVVNKIGTRMIALAARERNLPVYALSDTTKFINQALDEVRSDERRGDELWPDPPRGIKIINRYFEPTPLDYFTAIITEEGILSPADASKRAESSRIDLLLLDRMRS